MKLRSAIVFGAVILLVAFVYVLKEKKHSVEIASTHPNPANHVAIHRKEEVPKYFLTEKTNIERRKHLSDACERLKLEESTVFRSFMNQDHRLLYCRVNKCASTFLLGLLRRTIDCSRKCLREQMEILAMLPIENQLLLLENAYSFIFVREPYGRFFSYFSNRFYTPKETWSEIAPDIIRKYRENPSELSLKTGYDLTFAEFLQYVIDGFQSVDTMNHHVRPMHFQCNPCQLQYDFIGKLETFSTDVDYLLRQLKIRNITNEISKDVVSKILENVLFKPVDRLFKAIQEFKDTPIPVFNMFVRTWTYYQIRGQVSISIQMPFPRSQVHHITKEQYVEKLGHAIQKSKTMPGLKDQKMAAKRQAYSSVPIEILEKLTTVVETDCLLFGYDLRPDFAFNHSFKVSYDYFRAVNF